jgi:hypothetical protein
LRTLEEAEKILNLAHQKSLRILPVYIPSEESIQADTASRFQSIADWHLLPEVFSMMEARWEPLSIDLFASRASTQTRFFSWNATDRPEAVDALCQRWDFDLAYLFPPIPLFKRVSKKLETSRGTYILVTPFWEAQAWFASLLTLKVKEVRRLPFSVNLVTDLTMGSPPPMLEKLHLVAWKISGGVEASSPSLTKLFISSSLGGDLPQKAATIEHGRPSNVSFALPPFHSISSGSS